MIDAVPGTIWFKSIISGITQITYLFLSNEYPSSNVEGWTEKRGQWGHLPKWQSSNDVDDDLWVGRNQMTSR